MDIKNLSGDSTIRKFSFSNNKISFIYEDDNSNEDFLITINSTICFFEEPVPINVVQTKIIKISSVLEIDEKSNIYMTPTDFVSQMKLYKNKYHLALGLKSSEFSYIFQLIGYNIVFSVPIEDIGSVKIEKIEP